jgi:TusA-related sulfurtransferase
MRIDVRGEICPYPMLQAVAGMKRARAGETVEVLTDHPPALETIPTQAARLGFAVTVQEVAPGEWLLTLSQAGSGEKGSGDGGW